MATIPSGVTVHAGTGTLTLTGVTATALGGKVNFGQGTAYKVYVGTAPVSMNAPASGTRLSDGTLQITTGLTTVNQFICTFRSSAASAGNHHYPNFIHWVRGYLSSNGGVTVFLSHQYKGLAYAGCSPAGMAVLGGCSLDWTAIGI